MPCYVSKALTRLGHTPITPQTSPHAHTPIRFAKKGETQMVAAADTTSALSPKDKRYLQSIIGTLLYYGRALEYSILPALNAIAKEQGSPTVRTL